MTERESFSVEAMARGYHAYKHIWTAVVAGVMAVDKGPWGDGSVTRGCRYR